MWFVHRVTLSVFWHHSLHLTTAATTRVIREGRILFSCLVGVHWQHFDVSFLCFPTVDQLSQHVQEHLSSCIRACYFCKPFVGHVKVMFSWKTYCPHFPVQNAHPYPSFSVHNVHVFQLVRVAKLYALVCWCNVSSVTIPTFLVLPCLHISHQLWPFGVVSWCVVHPVGHWPLITENINSALLLTKHRYSVPLL